MFSTFYLVGANQHCVPGSMNLVPTLVVLRANIVGLNRALHFSSSCDDGCLFLFLLIPSLSLYVIPQVDMRWLVVWYFGRL